MGKVYEEIGITELYNEEIISHAEYQEAKFSMDSGNFKKQYFRSAVNGVYYKRVPSNKIPEAEIDTYLHHQLLKSQRKVARGLRFITWIAAALIFFVVSAVIFSHAMRAKEVKVLKTELSELKEQLDKANEALPVYKVVGYVENYITNTKYITVSGFFNEVGLRSICKEEYKDAEREYDYILFFEPKTPLITEKYTPEYGLPYEIYSIKKYELHLDDGVLKITSVE